MICKCQASIVNMLKVVQFTIKNTVIYIFFLLTFITIGTNERHGAEKNII